MTTLFHATPGTTSHGPRIERLRSVEALADAVVGLVATAVSQGVRRHGRANLILSGGKTPEAYLPQVASLNLPWDKVSVLLSDERWVDEGSEYSNTAMLRRTFFSQRGPAQATFIPLKNAAASAADGVAIARSGLPPLDQRYDLVLLGMGNDGHVASLFPDAPRLGQLLSPENAERIAAVPPPVSARPAVERISLTLAEIKRGERVVLVLQGAEKLDVLKQAWQSADPLRTPVFALGDVEVLWCP